MLVLLTLFGLSFLPGCGDGSSDRPPPIHHGGDSGGEDDGEGGEGGADTASGGKSSGRPTCSDGARKECTVYVNQANGITSCWKGVRFCVRGKYTDCLEPGASVPNAE